MTINVDESHGLETFGISLKDDDGNVVGYFTTNAGDPTGTPAPINTWCFDETSQVIFYKFGVGDNDWRQMTAEDITFDPTGLMNFDPTDTDVKKALERFGNQSVSDLTEAEGVTSAAEESTTSNGWVSKSGYPFLSSQIKTAGKFSLRWSSEVGQTTKNRNYGLRTRWRPEGGTWITLGEVQLSNARDDSFIMQSGFKEATLLTDSKIEVDIQHGQTTGGGSSLLKNASMEIRRIGD